MHGPDGGMRPLLFLILILILTLIPACTHWLLTERGGGVATRLFLQPTMRSHTHTHAHTHTRARTHGQANRQSYALRQADP